jgi:hypothetical protein
MRVKCIKERCETSLKIFESPEIGKVYEVVGMRDADLGPPKGELPQEICIKVKAYDNEYYDIWYSMYYFEVLKD